MPIAASVTLRPVSRAATGVTITGRTPSMAPLKAAARQSSRAAARPRNAPTGQPEAAHESDASATPAGSRWVDQLWGGWWALPVPPTPARPTVMAELVEGQVYGFDQLQGVLKILLNVRMTVVVLRGGGLLVNNPVAPTRECLALLQTLIDRHGPVRYITLSSAALEHKSYFAPFARRFPKAELWAAPGQWSFPLNIPFRAALWPRRLAGYLADSDTPAGRAAPWGDELRVAVLGVGGSAFTGFRAPWFVDVAILHTASKTLLVTDAVCQVPLDPVPVCELDPSPLLLRAAEEPGRGAEVPDTPANRRKGWWRVCLFATYAAPTTQTPESLAYDGFRWEPGWEKTFLCFAGRLVVHPILRVLCFNRRPHEVLAWADKVASWDFKRVVPGHFDAPVSASGRQFRAAFDFLEGADAGGRQGGLLGRLLGRARASPVVFPEAELRCLRDVDAFAVARGTSEAPVVYTGREEEGT